MITIGIPAYNCERSITFCIASVLSQSSLPDHEILVVDDGSTDGTASVLERLRPRVPQLRIIAHLSNRGRAAARSTLIENARGELFAFLDADDAWLPNKLERQMDAWNQLPGADRNRTMICGNLTEIDEDTGTSRVKRFAEAFGDSYSLLNVLKADNLPISQVGFASCDFLRSLGPFDGRLTRAQDWDFLIRFLAAGGRVRFVAGDPLAVFHFQRGGRNPLAILRCMDLVIEKHLPLYKMTHIDPKRIRSNIRRTYVTRFLDRKRHPLVRLLLKHSLI